MRADRTDIEKKADEMSIADPFGDDAQHTRGHILLCYRRVLQQPLAMCLYSTSRVVPEHA